MLKNSACSVGDLGSIPGLGRSPGRGHGDSSILAWRIPMNREAWQVTKRSTAHTKVTYFLLGGRKREKLLVTPSSLVGLSSWNTGDPNYSDGVDVGGPV